VNNKKKTVVRLKGEALKKRIEAVVKGMLYDPEVTPGQINVQEVAKRVPCSRVAIYENNMAPAIRLAQENKAKAADYSDKLKKARKPKLIKMQDRIQALNDELKTEKQRREVVEQLFYRLLINVITNSARLDIKKSIDELLSEEIKPLAFKVQLPFAQKKKEDYLERIARIRAITLQREDY